MCFQFSGVFASFGLSGIIPAIHYGLMEGWFNKISQASLGWLILMGKLGYHCNVCLRFLKNYRFSRTSLHHWSCLLCIACSRTMVPWQIWFMGKKYLQTIIKLNQTYQFINADIIIFITVSIPPNFPCFGYCRSICSLSWNQWNGNLSCYSRRMHYSTFSNYILDIDIKHLKLIWKQKHTHNQIYWKILFRNLILLYLW